MPRELYGSPRGEGVRRPDDFAAFTMAQKEFWAGIIKQTDATIEGAHC
jgi:hypothetical protein